MLNKMEQAHRHLEPSTAQKLGPHRIKTKNTLPKETVAFDFTTNNTSGNFNRACDFSRACSALE